MTQEKKIIVHNKSDKPDNVVAKEVAIQEECRKLEGCLPTFLRGYFAYLKGNVLPMTRLAYLYDLRFFCRYLIDETDLTDAGRKYRKDCMKAAADSKKGNGEEKDPRDVYLRQISLEEFKQINATDINLYIDYCRNYQREGQENITVYENSNRTLARKKSSLSVLFKQLYRDGLLPENITDGFHPIRVQKASEREIKALQDDEVMIMLDAVTTGSGLTKKEHEFWEKTKLRDKAILILFLTYGLRLSELQQLNVSSFNFNRGEFKIYRKRGKESIMPLNQSVIGAVRQYIEEERLIDEKIQEGDEDALFLSLRGKRMTDRQIRTMVKKYTSIGLHSSRDGGYSPHKLRATAATSLIGRGNSIYDVAALLDHEQVTTTQLYARHQQNVKRDLIKGMEWEEERRAGTHDPEKE